jgi:hypothetical protein
LVSVAVKVCETVCVLSRISVEIQTLVVGIVTTDVWVFVSTLVMDRVSVWCWV